MKHKKLKELGMMFLGLSLFTGCSVQGQEPIDEQISQNSQTVQQQSNQVEVMKSTAIEVEEIDWKNHDYTTLQLSEGSHTITQSGIYEITGTLEEGSLTVDIDKSVDEGTVYLVLNNAVINSNLTTPINIIDAEQVVILLEEETTNQITQGVIETADDDFPSAAIYSKADLLIMGNGTLQVNTAYQDAITSKDDCIIAGGTIEIQAASDGITGKDLVAFQDATLTITAGKDGMRATNDTDEDKGSVIIYSGVIDIHAQNDGIQAENTVEIQGGDIHIESGGGYTGVIAVNEGELLKQMRTQGNIMPSMPPGQEGEDGSTMPPMPPGQEGEDGSIMPPMPPRQEGEDGSIVPPMMIEEIQEEQIDEAVAQESMKAIKATGDIIIHDGTFTLSSYEDTFNSNANILIYNAEMMIESGEDAIHADEMLTIHDGIITILNAYEGLEASNIVIHGGVIDIVTTDDGINVNHNEGLLSVAGGTIAIVAGGDGIDSNNDFEMLGGEITVETTSNSGPGETMVDVDGTITMTGGIIYNSEGIAMDMAAIQAQLGPNGTDKTNKPMMPEGADKANKQMTLDGMDRIPSAKNENKENVQSMTNE